MNQLYNKQFNALADICAVGLAVGFAGKIAGPRKAMQTLVYQTIYTVAREALKGFADPTRGEGLQGLMALGITVTITHLVTKSITKRLIDEDLPLTEQVLLRLIAATQLCGMILVYSSLQNMVEGAPD